ncbi:MAG: ROK family protein [Nitrospirales bacterium]
MASPPTRMAATSKPITLSIDIGGSGIKGIRLGPTGQPIGERLRIVTPQPSTPKAVLADITKLVKDMGPFDRVSVGFPGVIQQGQVKTAPNLDQSWPGIHLVRELERQLRKPVRAANDADAQGYGAVKGKGSELVITLGTGFGTALFINGHLVPNLEIGHHPFRKGQTYEVQLSANALNTVGKKRWNLRLAKAIQLLDRVINFDHLYIGGGNAKKVTITLPSNVALISNVAGLLGGIALWADVPLHLPSSASRPQTKSMKPSSPSKRKPHIE